MNPETLPEEEEELEGRPATEQGFTVPPAAERMRLDVFLTAELPAFSRARLQALAREGHITLNGQPTKPSQKLRTGDTLHLVEPPAVPTAAVPEAIPLEILYEDADMVVIHKPAGMVVHGGAGNWTGTVVNALLHHCGGLAQIGGEIRPGIVHRLDKETSGCLVAAKTDAAHRGLVAQLAGRTVRKIYLALAAGHFAPGSGLVDAPLGRHPVDRKKMAVQKPGHGREARTGWRVLGEVPVPSAPGKVGSVVECTLHTGRTHQIRVHLKHLGHPILGDKVYGEARGFARQMLHAWQLGFTHPRTGQRVECVAPLPADFVEAGVTGR